MRRNPLNSSSNGRDGKQEKKPVQSLEEKQAAYQRARELTFLKKKKDPTPWSHIDKDEEARLAKSRKHGGNSGSGTIDGHVTSEKPMSAKAAKKASKQALQRMSSDEDSDDLIPEEVRSISKMMDFSKSERKWLISTLKLSPQLIDENLSVLLNVLNFLSKKEGVFYRYEKNDEEIWMVMEYMDGGTIKEAISNFTFTEKYVAYIIKQILHGLEYLHSLNIAHRDLKSANIMLNSKAEVKIIDFGFSIDLTLLKADIHMCGSPYWMAPEQIQEKPHDLSVDIWSLGMMVAEMMKGVVPHHKSKIKAMFLAASVGISFSREKKYSSHWSNELFDFLASCLQVDASKRPSASQLLQHPFIATAATKQETLDILPLVFMSKTISKYSSSTK
eukprot:gene2489-2832_t